jgi:hypothetical protein
VDPGAQSLDPAVATSATAASAAAATLARGTAATMKLRISLLHCATAINYATTIRYMDQAPSTWSPGLKILGPVEIQDW